MRSQAKRILAMILMLSLTAMLTVCLAEDAWLETVGTGTVSCKPDSMRVVLGVRCSADEVRTAFLQVNETIAEICSALADLGISEDAISTEGFYIYSGYDDPDDGDAVRYTAENSIAIETEDPDTMSRVIDAAFEAGANDLEGITFMLNDSEDARHRALELAVEDALEKAELSASAAGQRIVGITSIVEDMDGAAMPMYSRKAASIESSDAETRISASTIDVTESVRVRFAMEDAEG